MDLSEISNPRGYPQSILGMYRSVSDCYRRKILQGWDFSDDVGLVRTVLDKSEADILSAKLFR
jgi:hypothetical protein